MKKSALFYIFIFICFILPAAITSYGCRSSLFQSEINPAEEPPRIYDKSELIIKPNIASDINVSSNIQLKIPAGSVSQAARISISTAPPPFSGNGSLSYRGDVFTIDNVNSLKYASISFKIPDDKIGEIESLKILYYLSSDESSGFITPEFINGKAAVSLKNNFSAGETIINASPLPYISRRPEITFNASEFERTELMVSLVSMDIKAKFKTAGFNFYTDSAAIDENEMAHIAAELNRSAGAAAGAGFKTPSTAANNIDVYIMRFVNAAGNPLNEIIGLPRRAGNFARKYDIFLSSSPYDWNRIKNYNLASREYFHLCINEYYGAEKSPAELSKTGWEWFNEAAAAWFCASTLSNPFSMDEIYNSKTLNSLISDSNGLFTRKGGAGERWYFLWLLSNKYGSGKIAEMLNETASSRTFEDFARSNLKSDDFREYLDALMARSYDNIIEKAPQMSLPFTMRLKPLEAAAFKFNIEPGVNVSVKLSQDAAVKIYARLRSALSASRAASKNIIIKNSTYCELISPELIDSNIFDKFYIVSINADLSAATSASDKEIAVFSPQGANPYNSYIYPLSVTFDKNPDKTADVNLISTNVKFDALASISNGAYVLSAVKDYAAFETALYIKKEYLCALKTGIYNLAFTFKDGKTAALALTIIDTTPYKPPVRPVSLSLEPGLLILAHASQYDLNLIKITVKYEDGSIKYPDSGIAWKVSQGGGTILENIYRPVNEDFEQLQCGYTLEGFEPVYNYLTVSYSDQKIVPVVKILSENITAGDAVNFDASESIGGDMYEWLFDFSNLSNSAVESDIVKYWSGVSKTGHTYKKGGVYKLVLKVKNSDNHNYIKSSPPLSVRVKPLPPIVSPEGGIYNMEQLITLKAGEEVTKIIYTVDGSEPSMTNGNIYSAPFKIKKTVQLKVAAIVEENEKTAMIASDTVTINYEMNNSSIYPAFFEFDKNRPDSAEVEVKMELNGNALETISYNDYTLDPETDYSIINNMVIISKLFLKNLSLGPAELSFNFSAGEPQILKLEIFESAVFNSSIIPVRANFDKGINQADIHVTLILNGNELNGIKKGDYELKAGTDYVLIEERAVLKKEYLLTLPFGESKLDFIFSAGESQTLAINVYQSYIIVEPVKNPEFSFNAGTYFETLSVSITSATPGAAIKYTTDGSEPSQSNGLTYAAPIEVSANVTIKAIAFKGGMVNSQVVSNQYIIILPAASPEFTPEGGTYYYDQIVSITCATPDATIKYTLDGSAPSQINGILYSAPITISQTSTVKAIAYKSGFGDSAITTAEYIMLPPPQPRTEPPQFAPAAGTYADPQTVTLTCATAGATIKYTLDGSVPTDKHGTTYKNPFTVSSSVTVKAIAFKNGMADSNIVSASYEIMPPAANPQFTPVAGTYGPGLSVTITCATDGATIKYTTDGTDPSLANGFEYSTPLTINQTTTIKAIAIKAGIRDSQIVSAVYEILAPVADPQFSPAAGTYSGEQTINLTTATKNANIKYTLDGTDPSPSNGIVYKKSLVITESTTIKAYAYKSGLPDSQIVTAEYIINP